MNAARRCTSVFAAAALAALLPASSRAFELPPICAEYADAVIAAPATASLAELRAEVEKLIETDPGASVALMCRTIPRVERERGEDSADMAWWVASLGTPMIAFMDRMNEAKPLLAFARPILERRLGPHAGEVAEIHVANAWIATRQGRNADAAAEWRAALRIREHNPGARNIELQKILVGLAQTLSLLRQFDEAKRNLARAEAILVANGETASDAAAAIENTYINIAWREEDFAAVRAHAEKQIAIEEKMASPAAQRVPAFVWLGQALERQDEYEAAEAALRRAVEIAESKHDAPLQRHQFTAYTQLAGLLVTRGKPAEARDLALRAIAAGEATRGPEAPALVRPLQFLANAQLALGELPEALANHQRAGELISRHRQDVETPWIVAHHRGLARAWLALGERDLARASLESALRAAGDDPRLTIERAATLLALGSLEGSAGDEVPDALAAALALYRSRLPDSHPAILRTIADTCASELRSRGIHAANCDDAARRIESSPDADPLLRHDVYALGSELNSLRGNAEQAFSLAIRALAAANTLGTPDPLWRADFALARALDRRGDVGLAIFFGKQSIEQIERLRGRIIEGQRRLERSFLVDKLDVYRTVADWLMAAGRIDEGLDVLRLLKAEELYDFVLRDADWSRDSGIELTAEELSLRDRFQALMGTDAATGTEIDRLSRLRESDRISPAERSELDSLLASQRQLEAGRVDRIQEFLTSGDEERSPPARSVQTERMARELASFGPDTALGFYLLTDTRLRVLIATRRGQYVYESAVDGPALRRDIGRFLSAIGRQEDVSASSRALYAAVARPLDEEARRAGAKRLVLWLDGALRYVPFAALHDGKRYLVDRYAIESYFPRAMATEPEAEDRDAARKRELTVRGLGLTRAIGGFEALPGMADELCDVVKGPIEGLELRGRTCPRDQYGDGALHGIGFADAAFTAQRLQSLLADPRDFSVLHLGTHFRLRPGNARRSYLLLGDGSRLTLDAIAGMDFRDLRLVTLSACQSGIGGATTDDGREVEGLSAIVQQRGARSVVASLWRVEDRSTAMLMRELYDNLPSQRGKVAAALRRSQLKLRGMGETGSQPYEHPYFWAGFIVSSN